MEALNAQADTIAGRCQLVACTHPTVHEVAERVLKDLRRASMSGTRSALWHQWPKGIALQATLPWFLKLRGYLVLAPPPDVNARSLRIDAYWVGQAGTDLLSRSKDIRSSKAHGLAVDYLVYLITEDARQELERQEVQARGLIADGKVPYLSTELWEGKG